ncbi:MAG TPA: hypothetical protein VHM25_17340 [Polyangiaceae bacterium]|jgi:hypothetical protein|nr:hypothetical protein [Polyangiaceae bacterium]
MGASADARSGDRRPRDDSAFDLIEVPATVVCAGCGDPACGGCVADERTNQSGVVAIIPWERPGLGFWHRLWQTSTLSTLHARTFFGALPDGEVSTALAFALVCETIAVSGLALGVALLGLAFLPALPGLMWDDPALRKTILRGAAAGVVMLVLAMVSLHTIHGLALDAAARRYGGRRVGRGVRFGLYACGWDLVTLPLGLLITALGSGFTAARRAAPLGLTAPKQASEAFLIGMHGLSPETARLAARRAAYFAIAPVLLTLALCVLVVAAALH